MEDGGDIGWYKREITVPDSWKGKRVFHEFELLHDAGLSNLEILQGVTTEAARIFGLTDRGTVEVGKRADLVLVEGVPTQNISACRNIKQVWVKGVEA